MTSRESRYICLRFGDGDFSDPLVSLKIIRPMHCVTSSDPLHPWPCVQRHRFSLPSRLGTLQNPPVPLPRSQLKGPLPLPLLPQLPEPAAEMEKLALAAGVALAASASGSAFVSQPALRGAPAGPAHATPARQARGRVRDGAVTAAATFAKALVGKGLRSPSCSSGSNRGRGRRWGGGCKWWWQRSLTLTSHIIAWAHSGCRGQCLSASASVARAVIFVGIDNERCRRRRRPWHRSRRSRAWPPRSAPALARSQAPASAGLGAFAAAAGVGAASALAGSQHEPDHSRAFSSVRTPTPTLAASFRPRWGCCTCYCVVWSALRRRFALSGAHCDV